MRIDHKDLPYQLDMRTCGHWIHATDNNKELYDIATVEAQARADNPTFDKATPEAQETMRQDAYSKHMRQLFLANFPIKTKIAWQVVTTSLIYLVLLFSPPPCSAS